MKNYLFLLLFLIVCYSCKKSYYWGEYRSTFTFQEKELTVRITDTTHLFFVKGKVCRVYPSTGNRDFEEIIVVPELTTATDGKQYALPENMTMRFSTDSLSDRLQITLFPENITQPVFIGFTTSMKTMDKDYSKYIDTLTVKLLPIKE